ncbi:glucose dehydrogenase [FAD, quinone]-like [Galleria mellonella]|uniref:Glucose dehydrogenase [FAD, quinone]-like n=1 Tax=Galleria mellonella TaxID=7137 RepID=A0A6J3C469_GALME|nr:glucose dehydrogenase [FAD, quinone]-like [Galleria mellonella]
MATVWQPADIASVCPNQIAPLTQCSQTGFMFLALVTQLFGNSVDNQFSYPNIDPYSDGKTTGIDNQEQSLTAPPFGTPALGEQIPLGSPIKPNVDFKTFPDFGPSLTNFKEPNNGHKTTAHSFGPNGSYGISETTFKINHGPSFNYNTSQKPNTLSANLFSNFESTPPIFDYNLIGRSGLLDSNTADSKTVTVTEKIKRKNRKKRQAIEEYDFIVVGAGSAGCVIANRLSEVKKWKVLLLEAGPEEPDVTSVPAFAPTLGGSSIDWSYRTQPEELTCRAQLGQTCRWIRGKSMGGSSAVNYLLYIRGNRRDYDSWAEAGNHGWSYAEVLPYFKKAENNQDIESHDLYYHSTTGPLNVERYQYVDVNTMMLVRAFNEKGLPIKDLNGASNLGTDIAQSTSKDGRRFSVNTAYIRPIRHRRPNLHIVTEAFVTKIMIDPFTKTAYGVQYVKNGIIYNVRSRKEVILSSGSLNSPKVLMLSGVGPKHHLESLNIPVYSDLRVGENLQDHVTTDALIISLSNKTSTAVSGNQLMQEVYNYYHQFPKKNGPLASTSTLSGTAFIKTEFAEQDAPDIQFHFDGRNIRDFYSDPTTYLASNIFPLSFYDGISARPLLLTPKSRGFLLLNYTDPVFGQPLIYSKFFTEKRDIDTLIAGIKYAVSLENTEAFRASGASFIKIPVQACANYIWGTYEYFKCILIQYTSTIYHPVGTCKMGPKWDNGAVVDSRLRVYGIKNLRVIDSSVMPTIIRGNTNAPTIMIAEKGTDMIKEDWLLPL